MFGGSASRVSREVAARAFHAYGDVYAALFRLVMDTVPSVVTKAFRPTSMPSDAECGLLWFYAGGETASRPVRPPVPFAR